MEKTWLIIKYLLNILIIKWNSIIKNYIIKNSKLKIIYTIITEITLRKRFGWINKIFLWFKPRIFVSFGQQTETTQTCVWCCKIILLIRLKQIHLLNSIKKFCNINKIFCRVNKTGQLKTLVHSTKRIWTDKQKFSSSN